MVRNIEDGPASEDPRANRNPEELAARADNLRRVGETLSDVVKEIIAREEEKKTNPLLVARRQLIDIRNAKVSGQEYDPGELERVNEEVIRLEQEQRDQQDPPQ